MSMYAGGGMPGSQRPVNIRKTGIKQIRNCGEDGQQVNSPDDTSGDQFRFESRNLVAFVGQQPRDKP
ncbi:hypothetical protein ANCCEY_08569 [Ancylostoma ceylanicum]|uniref:Uncharacterized protein n=1 Tax=Ancylostoma ceylanicum TaxID=53326 RepID=A0A0D6LXI5_9BILA|nr:hypothetical protein ANCCEY_08569 [Ancylostoma ceylanicum]